MTGSDATPESADAPADDAAPAQPEWWREPSGRWTVGDAGGLPRIVKVPAQPGTERPDTAANGARVGKVAYHAASLRGPGHLETGKPRQDSYQVRVSRDREWLVGCVADGVAEGRLSHVAADLACEIVADRLTFAFSDLAPDQDWSDTVAGLPWAPIVTAVNEAIRTAALSKAREAYNRKPDEYAEQLARLETEEYTLRDARRLMSTTAVAFAVATRPDADGSYRTMVAVLAGDSGAMRLTGGVWHPLTAVKNADKEVVDSGVSPLPREVTVDPVPLLLKSGDVLLVMTDGLGDPLGSGRGVVGRFLAEMWRAVPDETEFQQQLGFYRRTFIDDRTAIVIWTDSAS